MSTSNHESLMRQLYRWAGVLTLLFTSTAQAQTASPVPFTPPEIYKTLWAGVEKCAGTISDPDATFEQIKWFMRTPVVDEAGDTLIGQWSPPDTIFITTGMPGISWQDSSWVIAHEMLHHKLGVFNDPNTPHPWIPFAFPCRLMPFQQSAAGIMKGRGH